MCAVALVTLAACGHTVHRAAPAASASTGALDHEVPAHTSTIVLAPDQHTLWVVRPDDDTVSVLDTEGARPPVEIALGSVPYVDARGDYVTGIAPRSIALAPDHRRAYVAAERSGEVVAIDTVSHAVRTRARVCARPVGVLVTPDEHTVLVTCAADALVLALDPVSLAVRARVAVGALPWSLALEGDGRRVHVGHLHGPGITTLGLDPLAIVRTETIPAQPPRGHRTLAHGTPRSLYDVAVRPGPRGEIWVAHELHANDTPQPELDFESTVFPALSITGDGARTLTTDSRLANHPGVRDGEFGDVVSGPRAMAFTPDGRFVLVVDQASDDVLVVDAARGVESTLLRPIPGYYLQGIALSDDGTRAWVDARNSGTVIALHLAPDGDGLVATVDGSPRPSRVHDPMPAEMRVGQRVFTTADDTDIPVTTNHWMACASCHPEGTTDRITYLFSQGPRDVPVAHAGADGFLFRTADRNDVMQFERTIEREQGGAMRPDDDVLAPYLRAMRAYVLHAIPVPPPPTTDPARVLRGRVLFERADTGCTQCHDGTSGSDSGRDNPSLDLAGTVRLHDVGTCVRTGPHPDVPHGDHVGHARAACAFDTPALRGLDESAPYLHDGSAATLRDVITTHNAGDHHGHTSQLSADEVGDLVEYLRSR